MADTPKRVTARRLLSEKFASMANVDNFKPRLEQMIARVKSGESYNQGALADLFYAMGLHVKAGNIPANDPLVREAEKVLKPIARKRTKRPLTGTERMEAGQRRIKRDQRRHGPKR